MKVLCSHSDKRERYYVQKACRKYGVKPVFVTSDILADRTQKVVVVSPSKDKKYKNQPGWVSHWKGWFGYPKDNIFLVPSLQALLTQQNLVHVWEECFARAAMWCRSGWKEYYWGGDLPGAICEQLENLGHNDWPLAIDIENVGDPLNTHIRAIGIGHKDHAVSIPDHELEKPRVQEFLRELLESDRPKIMHNFQHDYLALTQQGYKIGGKIHDTLVLHVVVFPGQPHGLDYCATQFLWCNKWKAEFKKNKVDREKGEDFWQKVPLELLCPYNQKDVLATARIWDRLEPELKDSRIANLYNERMELSFIAMEMRRKGVKVDESKRLEWSASLGEKMEKTRLDFERVVGLDASLGKNGQHPSLRPYFFEKLGVKLAGNPKNEKRDSLDKKALGKIIAWVGGVAAERAKEVLDYRKAAILKTNNIDGLKLDPENVLHPTFNVTGAVTGRSSSQKPNFQNWNEKIRDIIVPRKSGNWIVGADYNALELRVAALLAGDDEFMQAFRDYDKGIGDKIHVFNLKKMIPGAPPTKENIRLVKIMVYLIQYGGQAETLYENLKLDFPQMSLLMVQKLIDAWYAARPKMKIWQNQTINFCEKEGYVEEVFSGLRRYYPIRCKPTEVTNFPVQGAAGFIANQAWKKVWAMLDHSQEYMLCMLHDAFYLEGPDPKRLSSILQEGMSTNLSLGAYSLDFPVEIKQGKNMREFDEKENPQGLK